MQTPFNQDFLDEIKKNLLEERDRLEKELAKFTTKSSHVSDDFDAIIPDYGNEEDDNAREVAEFTANKPLEITLERTLRDVNEALKRIEEGVYGICKYCHKPIDEKRVHARPTSSSCVSCKKTITQEA